MADVRTSFVLDDLLLARVDAVAKSKGLNRSEYLRDLIYRDQNKVPPRESEKLVQVQEMGWYPRDPLHGVPRFVVYRSDGTFHSETASSPESLFSSVEEYHRVRGGVGTPAAWEKYWRMHACQPLWVGDGPWSVGYFGDDVPDLTKPHEDYMIQFCKPFSQNPENRTQFKIAPFDPNDREGFDEMLAVLRGAADEWRNAQ